MKDHETYNFAFLKEMWDLSGHLGVHHVPRNCPMRTSLNRSLFRSEFTICGQVREDNVAPIPNVVIPNAQLLEFLGSKDLWWVSLRPTCSLPTEPSRKTPKCGEFIVREVPLQNAVRLFRFFKKNPNLPSSIQDLEKKEKSHFKETQH